MISNQMFSKEIYMESLCYVLKHVLHFNDYEMMFKPLVTSYKQANYYVHIMSQGNHGVKGTTWWWEVDKYVEKNILSLVA